MHVGTAPTFIPVLYGNPLPKIEDGSVVYILDFSYSREVLDALAARTTLVVLDHHKTAQADLVGAPYATFDMNKSGAILAWEYFNPTGEYQLPATKFVKYVQDRDLWRFVLPHSREIAQWLRSIPYTFDAYDQAYEDFALHFEDVVKQGTAMLDFQNQQVDTMAGNRFHATFCGHLVPVTNAPVFYAEVGERMLELESNAAFAAYYFDRPNAWGDVVRQWGLRSNRGFDVSVMAKRYGGGGHAAAAGFVTSTEFYGDK